MSEIISITALVISILTFWWTYLRKHNAIFLINRHEVAANDRMRFAFVNSSTADILLSKLEWCFASKDRNSVYTPMQHINPNNIELIESNKGYNFEIMLIEKITEQFIKTGEIKKSGTVDIYYFDTYLSIEWIEMNGIKKSRDILFCGYGFQINSLTISHYFPYIDSINIYKNDKRRLLESNKEIGFRKINKNI